MHILTHGILISGWSSGAGGKSTGLVGSSSGPNIFGGGGLGGGMLEPAEEELPDKAEFASDNFGARFLRMGGLISLKEK